MSKDFALEGLDATSNHPVLVAVKMLRADANKNARYRAGGCTCPGIAPPPPTRAGMLGKHPLPPVARCSVQPQGPHTSEPSGDAGLL